MKSKVSTVRTGSWAMLSLAGLACLASACSSSNTSSGTGGATGSGGAKASGGSGMGGSGTGGAAAGGAPGMGGSGAGGAVVDAGGDHPATTTDSGTMDAARDAIVVHDGSTTDAGSYVRAGWTAVAMPDHVPPAQTNPQSNESLATSNAFDGMNGTRWATGVFQDTLTFPLYFTVNMQQVMSIGRITLYAGSQDTGDFPVQLDVLVSDDGVNFTTAVAAHRPAPPANGIDTININPKVVGQWIQLKATMGQPTGNRRWWAIGEMNVYP